MTGVGRLAKIDDNLIKQLAFFYELTKMGAVKFDFNNRVHVDTLVMMINRVVELQGMDTSRMMEYERMAFKNRLKFYELIIFQILKHSVR